METTILVIDDEPSLRLLVRETLARRPWRVIEAASGAEGVELARKHVPDLIVLDWMMPGMDGLEVCRALAERPDTADVPILMLTARGQVSDMAAAARLQVQDYLVKPFRPAVFRAAVERLLSKQGS